jgi:hypothetical protein
MVYAYAVFLHKAISEGERGVTHIPSDITSAIKQTHFNAYAISIAAKVVISGFTSDVPSDTRFGNRRIHVVLIYKVVSGRADDFSVEVCRVVLSGIPFVSGIMYRNPRNV